MSISKLFVKDTFTDEISEHSSVIEVHEFIKEIIQKDFCINLIYKNKHRKMRVCRRFYVSESRDFKMKEKSKTSTSVDKSLKNHKTDILNQRWFKNKTRIVKR